MPNWCDNRITFSGPEKTIKKILKDAKGPHAHYNDIPHNKEWGAFEDIRIKSLFSQPAESNGPIYDFCFHSLVPIPEEYRRFPYDDNRAREARTLMGIHADVGGYSKQNELWGTKWDVDATPEILDNWEDEDKNKYMSFQVYCDTAWGPPLEFAQNVSGKYKDVEIETKFEEPGMGFAGTTTFLNGECIFEEEGECMCHECDLPMSECEGDCE